jgi:hypothetical protein
MKLYPLLKAVRYELPAYNRRGPGSRRREGCGGQSGTEHASHRVPPPHITVIPRLVHMWGMGKRPYIVSLQRTGNNNNNTTVKSSLNDAQLQMKRNKIPTYLICHDNRFLCIISLKGCHGRGM